MPVPESAGEPRRRTIGRLLSYGIVISLFAFWIWAFSPWAPRTNPERLDDRAWVARAEARCVDALAEIDLLPSGLEADTTEERADQVQAATHLVEQLVADLRASVAPDASPADLERIGAWLEDWDQYVSDRYAHVDRLRAADADTAGRDLAFVVSDLGTGGIYTRRMDGFARANSMDSCTVPGDV